MPESQNENVEKEVVQPTEGAVANQQTSEQHISQESRPDSQEKNWKEVREIMQQQKREIAALKDELSKQHQSKASQEDELAQLLEDDVLTVRDAKKLASKIARQVANEALVDYKKKSAVERVPSQYSDYAEVVQKYADRFEKENPAAAQAILSSPNPRLAAYQMIKSWHVYKNEQAKKSNEVSEAAEKVLENSKKPGSSQSVGAPSPLNEIKRYERMTSKRANEIRKMAEEYAMQRN